MEEVKELKRHLKESTRYLTFSLEENKKQILSLIGSMKSDLERLEKDINQNRFSSLAGSLQVTWNLFHLLGEANAHAYALEITKEKESDNKEV